MAKRTHVWSVVSCTLAAMQLIGATARCATQASASVGGCVIAANNPASPLHIIGFESRAGAFEGPFIVMQNASARDVIRYRLDAAINPPQQCVSSGQLQLTHGSDREFNTPTVRAGQTVRVYWNLLGPQHLVWAAKRANSSFVQLQLAVAEVEFADGTVWKRGSPEDAFLSPEELDKLAPSDCAPWKEMRNALDDVKEVQSRPDAPRGCEVPSPDHLLAFGFSCRIAQHTAICPTNYGMTPAAPRQ